MDPLSTLALSTVFAAVGFYVLYLVVRAAVLSALRAHAGERNATGVAGGREAPSGDTAD